MENRNYLFTHVSVDCVIFGFDGKKLNVLLVDKKAHSNSVSGLKLPGSLIYHEENTDQAAERVLYEMTGLKKITIKQFKCFSSIERTSNPDDQDWLALEYGNKIGRLITIAYLSLIKIDHKINVPKFGTAVWCPIDGISDMPFDHNQIVKESLKEIHKWFVNEPQIAFELLPSKFTASQLRILYEAICHRKYDVRNFHKKMLQLDYIVSLDEWQKKVSHRAARYYKFDKVQYKKRMSYI